MKARALLNEAWCAASETEEDARAMSVMVEEHEDGTHTIWILREGEMTEWI